MHLVTGLQQPGAADFCLGAGPHLADVVQGTRLPGAHRDTAGVPAALVLRVQQQPDQLLNGAAGARDVAGDSGRDPVPVLDRTLPVTAPDHAPAVQAEPALTTGRIAAGEIAEQEEIGCRRRELTQALPAGRVRGLSLWFCLMGVVWHGGVVSQGHGRHPGPLKPRVASGTDLQSVPEKPPGLPVLGAFLSPAPCGGTRPHRSSTKVKTENRREHYSSSTPVNSFYSKASCRGYRLCNPT